MGRAQAPGRARRAGALRPTASRGRAAASAAIPKRASSVVARARASRRERKRRSAATRQVREERVVLEDEPDRPLSGGRSTPPRLSNHTRLRARCGRSSGRARPAIVRSTVLLPAPGRAGERDDAVDARARARVGTPGGRARDQWKRVHEGSSLTARRTATLTTTRNAPRRERDVEVDVELRVDGERQRLGLAGRLPANMIVAPNSPSAARERERRGRGETAGGEGRRHAANVARARRRAFATRRCRAGSRASNAAMPSGCRTGSRRR